MNSSIKSEINTESMHDDDHQFFLKLKEIIQAKYGPIEVEEPVFHTAIANAAALQYLISILQDYHKDELVNVSEKYENIRNNVDDTLLFFEKNIKNIIKKSAVEVFQDQLHEYRSLSNKQISQVKRLLESHEPPKPPPEPKHLTLKALLIVNCILILIGIVFN